MISKLLIVGTALDGPSEYVVTSPIDSIEKSLSTYGEVTPQLIYMTPSGTTINLDSSIWSNDVKILYEDGTNYKRLIPVNLTATGSSLTFDSLQLTESVSGWLLYRGIPSASDLPFQLKIASLQNSYTPILDGKVSTLRVVGSNAVKPTLNLGILKFTYLNYASVGNYTKIDIDNEFLTITPVPGNVFSPLGFTTNKNSYSISPIKIRIGESLTYTDNYTLTKTLGDLVEKVNSLALKQGCPVSLEIVSPYVKTESTLSLTGVIGEYYLTGGVDDNNPTARDYYNALDSIDPSEFDIIVMPSLLGEEFFPFASYLLEDFQGFPFSFVCQTTGTTLSEVADDLWVSERFYLVQGKGYPKTLPNIETDFTTAYGAILCSNYGVFGGGTKAPLGFYLNTPLPTEDMKEMADSGVVCTSSFRNTLTVYKGTTTKVSLPVQALSTIRVINENLIESLKDLVGRVNSTALAQAERAVANALDNAVKKGTLMVDYVSQVELSQDVISVYITFEVSGLLEKISTSVSIYK